MRTFLKLGAIKLHLKGYKLVFAGSAGAEFILKRAIYREKYYMLGYRGPKNHSALSKCKKLLCSITI